MKKLSFVVCASVAWAISITTSHVDNTRQNANTSETILTPATVVVNGFGKIGSWPVDGRVFAQPLIVQSVTISGSTHDVLIVVTMHDSVYAFDANNAAQVLWQTSVGTSRTVYPTSPTLYGAENGCLSTPVIDSTNNLLYVACATNAPGTTLFKLNLLTGSVLSSAIISGQVVGTGDPLGGDTVNGSNLLFYPTFENQRPGLVLSGSHVYVGFGSYNDDHPWHGWVFSYNTSDLSQAAVFCTTPNGSGGAVWGGAPAVDGSGNLYVLTGNGNWDGTANFGSSVIKLSSSLSLLDWFTPSNWSTLNTNDQDLASGQIMLVGTRLIFGAKDGNIYNVNSACMGNLGGTANACVAPQVFLSVTPTCTGDCGIYNGNAFFNNTGFFPNVAEKIRSYAYSAPSFTTSPAATSASSFSFPGPSMTVSANGTSNPILWAVTTTMSNETVLQGGVLRALNPVTLTEYWNSEQSGHDSLGTVSKFSAPVVANGKVYVSTQDNRVLVYGLGSFVNNPAGVATHMSGAENGQSFN